MYTKSSKITEIPLIGENKATLLQRLNIYTVKDLLFHIPSKYRDTKEIKSIAQFKLDMFGTIIGQVEDIKNVYTRSRKVISRIKFSDETGSIYGSWFNQSYITKNFTLGERYILSGKISPNSKIKDIINPEYEHIIEEIETKHLGKITPYYPETEGLSSKWIRSRIQTVLPYIEELVTEPLSQEILKQEKLLSLPLAISQIHNPQNEEEIIQSRSRLEFDEMLNIAINIERNRKEYQNKYSHKLEIHIDQVENIINRLPYKLTLDQEKAIEEILSDMNTNIPMHRLLNGDVGSGKTIVAAMAMYNSYLNNKIAVLLAPTTILAQQHYESFKEIFKDLDINIKLITSKSKEKEINEVGIYIGTQAVLYNKVKKEEIGILVIDEQHRFGVKQRNQLKENTEYTPHYLTMSATPIPRTLTNILFGDMSVSFLREMPKNRIPIKTYYVPENKIDDGYKWIKDRIIKSNNIEQAFIIFPLIEQSEKSDLKAATQQYEILSQSIFKGIKCKLIHGKLKEDEKKEILIDFKANKFNILFATSVIEVGIDIPNATIIVIENAERFGLAQLHQFRGRVGRSNKESFCFVINKENDNNSTERLKYFSNHLSGFDVSEYDLERRGPGEVFGNKQSGIPNLKVASINNIKLLLKCRDIAKNLINEYPNEINNIIENLYK